MGESRVKGQGREREKKLKKRKGGGGEGEKDFDGGWIGRGWEIDSEVKKRESSLNFFT